MMRWQRVANAWRVLRGRADVAVSPERARSEPVDPVEVRPDPSARFNVFRVTADGRLALDARRYSGNVVFKAVAAYREYERAPDWLGAVYFYDGATCIERTSR